MLLVTNNDIFNNMSADVARTQKRAYDAHRTVSSGKRVNLASDDPIAAARGSLNNTALASLAAMDRTARIATSQLLTADGVLDQCVRNLSKASELAVAGASPSLSADNRAALAGEVQVIHDFVISASNATQAGIYLFAGFANVAPFANDGTYSGDDGIRYVDVAPGLRLAVNLPGSQVFNIVGGQNVLEDLQNFVTALNDNDLDAVRVAIDNMESDRAQLTGARAQLAANLIKAETGEQKREEAVLLLRKERSESVEADQAEALVRMTEAQTALQTAMSSAARIIEQLNANPLLR